VWQVTEAGVLRFAPLQVSPGQTPESADRKVGNLPGLLTFQPWRDITSSLLRCCGQSHTPAKGTNTNLSTRPVGRRATRSASCSRQRKLQRKVR
jgi:hypothetical protein